MGGRHHQKYKDVKQISKYKAGVELREMAQRNVEWYSVHTNSVALHEMAQRNVEWYSVDTNGVAQVEQLSGTSDPEN